MLLPFPTRGSTIATMAAAAAIAVVALHILSATTSSSSLVSAFSTTTTTPASVSFSRTCRSGRAFEPRFAVADSNDNHNNDIDDRSDRKFLTSSIDAGLRRMAATAAFTAVFAAAGLFGGGADSAWADGSTKEFKLPPIDLEDKNRCVFTGSKMGQANAARDKLYDLRQCQLSGKDASGFDLSGTFVVSFVGDSLLTPR